MLFPLCGNGRGVDDMHDICIYASSTSDNMHSHGILFFEGYDDRHPQTEKELVYIESCSHDQVLTSAVEEFGKINALFNNLVY